jgi:hypothetical protein
MKNREDAVKIINWLVKSASAKVINDLTNNAEQLLDNGHTIDSVMGNISDQVESIIRQEGVTQS